ncbi:thymidylate kinase [Pseudovirgaria hyperparasitica]|uniref:Thymidylate kinase n=1 Tax=Pseudovirgaria hyperparasitica TaxID=470096 RepID=A0A6A6VVU8_9PEZI|nr:thymidylate kinase [Pseudovirgaria hyperparasitica]KAF2754808.1 thymidylate kinase [Pseudovirgaria hyperparasitica]
MRGKLIVFEGLDKAGKSTQCSKLVEAMRAQGKDVKQMRFPDRTTPIGQMINNYLTGDSEQEDHVIHLLFSANRWEAAASIQKDIAAGKTVIVDRYYYSGIVYSAAKRNPALSLLWARHPEVGLPRPDICIFLDISPEDAAKRGDFGSERYESTEMQDRVRELFGVLREGQEKADFVRIDAGGELEEVHRLVREAVDRVCEGIDLTGLPLRFVQP